MGGPGGLGLGSTGGAPDYDAGPSTAGLGSSNNNNSGQGAAGGEAKGMSLAKKLLMKMGWEEGAWKVEGVAVACWVGHARWRGTHTAGLHVAAVHWLSNLKARHFQLRSSPCSSLHHLFLLPLGAGEGLGRERQGMSTPLVMQKTAARTGVIVNAEPTGEEV